MASSPESRHDFNFIGFEAPGKSDAFGDGTPCVGRPMSMEVLPASKEFIPPESPPHRAFNPPAGTIHRRECAGLWRRETINRIAADEKKAETEGQEKRVWGLARQTCAGLLTGVGVKYDLPTMANYVRAGFAARRKQNEALARRAGSKDDTPILTADEERDMKVLEAVRKFDCIEVARLLQLRVKSNANSEVADLRTTVLKFLT
jgi:hypothetical protein